MHESTVVRDLVAKASQVVQADGGDPQCLSVVRAVTVRQGTMGHLSPSHLADYFAVAAAGTPVEGAELIVDVEGDDTDLVLVSITVEDG